MQILLKALAAIAVVAGVVMFVDPNARNSALTPRTAANDGPELELLAPGRHYCLTKPDPYRLQDMPIAGSTSLFNESGEPIAVIPVSGLIDGLPEFTLEIGAGIRFDCTGKSSLGCIWETKPAGKGVPRIHEE